LGPRLEVRDNLRYRELEFQLALFSGARRLELSRQYRSLVKAILADDLYGGVQKVWAPVLFGVAVALPRSARGSWLSMSLSASKTKEVLRRALRPRGGRDDFASLQALRRRAFSRRRHHSEVPGP
jgi:hypothetical protein